MTDGENDDDVVVQLMNLIAQAAVLVVQLRNDGDERESEQDAAHAFRAMADKSRHDAQHFWDDVFLATLRHGSNIDEAADAANAAHELRGLSCAPALRRAH